MIDIFVLRLSHPRVGGTTNEDSRSKGKGFEDKYNQVCESPVERVNRAWGDIKVGGYHEAEVS